MIFCNFAKNLNYSIVTKKTKHVLAVLVILLFAVVGMLYAGSVFMLSVALAPNRDTTTQFEYGDHRWEKRPEVKNWLDSVQQCKALLDTFITNDNGARLHAFYLRASQPTAKTAIIVHGYKVRALGMAHIAKMYDVDLHYNILLPDLYAHGDSEGEAIQMGWNDRLDVMRWMEVADSLFGGSTLQVVHGISMGAATTMMVSGENPKQARCYIEDCGYTSVWDEFSLEIVNRYSKMAYPMMYTSSWLCKLRYGWSFTEASAVEQVKRCQKPMLFIHGGNDTFVPTAMVHEVYAAKKGEKELWIAEGSIHARSYDDYPELYTQKVKTFLNKHMQ